MNLDDLRAALPDWLTGNGEALGWLVAVAAASWVVTLLAVPVLIARIPVDYFSREQRHTMYSEARHPVVGWALATLKNVFGVLLVMIGLVMLVTPGQGVLTILIGLLLVNFPGKYRLERWVVLRPGVLRALNGFRARIGKPPLDSP